MPRVGLNREKLVATAMAMADEGGLAALSMHALARHYGVAAPSMYKHVRNLEDLQCAIASEALTLFEHALSGAEPGIAGLARAYRTFATGHPGLYEATQRPVLFKEDGAQETSSRIISRIAAQLPENLTPDDVVHHVRIIRSALHGFVELERAEGFGLPQSLDATFDELCTSLQVITSLGGVAASKVSKPPANALRDVPGRNHSASATRR